jgi:hypothetical protein
MKKMKSEQAVLPNPCVEEEEDNCDDDYNRVRIYTNCSQLN